MGRPFVAIGNGISYDVVLARVYCVGVGNDIWGVGYIDYVCSWILYLYKRKSNFSRIIIR